MRDETGPATLSYEKIYGRFGLLFFAADFASIVVFAFWDFTCFLPDMGAFGAFTFDFFIFIWF
jgi:hypothetical protein